MNPNKLKEITINLPEKFDNILKKIDENGLGVIFVVDKLNRLKGSITDGDIRRFYLKKIRLPKIIDLKSKILNKKTFSLPVSTNIQNILKYLEPNPIKNATNFKCIPLVNKKKVIIDIATKENPRDYPVAQPDIGSQELQNVLKTVKSGWISSKGAYI